MQATLFDSQTPTKKIRPPMPDARNIAAVRLRGMPDGWQWFELNRAEDTCPPGFTRVIGAVPIGKKRDGRPKWPKKSESQTLFLSDAELDEAERIWERENSKCFDCAGTGEEWCGWSKDDGNRYRPCSKCKATGLPASQ